MKKRVIDISLIVYFIALVFVPITFYSSASYTSIFTFMYYNYFYLSIAHFYIPFVFSIIYIATLIAFVILLILKKDTFRSLLAPIIGYLLFSLVTAIWDGPNLFLGFYLSILSVVIWVIYFINQKTNFISKLNNRQRKPTNKERIAQLEKELQELKNKSN